MNPREEHLIEVMTTTSRRFWLWIGFLGAVVLLGLVAYGIQLRKGLIVTGLRDQVSWGIYISTFVFWVGVSKGGTMISAILRITNAEWRTPMTRLAEAITVLALLAGVPMIVADLGRPDRIWHLLRYGRIQSPLIWDFLSVGTYLTACVIYFYLPLIPDVALLADRPHLPNWRRKLYRLLALRWQDTARQRQLLERAIHVMAIIVIPLAVSVHTVVSWIFAMTLRPGWNSTIYGPYFVVGAIYSGAAAVIVCMWVLRRAMHLEEYIRVEHFCKLGKLLLASTLVYLYFNVNEYLTVGYKLEGFERDLMDSLFVGRYARLFWSVQGLGVLAPIAILMAFLLIPRLKQFAIGAVGLASALIVVGAWAKRFLIVVPTLETPFLPAQRIPAEWTHYSPTWIEWAIVAGALAFFLLAYTLVAKIFPIVSIWENREHASESSPVVSRDKRLPPLVTAGAGFAILLVALGLLGNPGQVEATEKTKAAPQQTTIRLKSELVQLAGKPTGIGLSAIPGVERTLENPFPRHHQREQGALPTVAVTAELTDATGKPVTFKPISFSVKTFYGVLSLGVRPTGADGIARLKITDRRYGPYEVRAAFAGDPQATASEGILRVEAASRPAPGLPEEGMLITPYPTLWITLPFLLFFGTMWIVFAYVAWNLIRVHRASGEGTPE